MEEEARRIKLGLASFLDRTVWKSNAYFTDQTRDRIVKEQQLYSKYQCLTSAFENIKAFLESAVSHKRVACLFTYRQILKNDPTNLNALLGFNAVSTSSNTEKQSKISACSARLQTEVDRNIAVGKACLEIGFAMVQLNQQFDCEHMRTKISNVQSSNDAYVQHSVQEIRSDLLQHLRFESENDMELPYTKRYSTMFTWNSSAAIHDTNKDAVLYLTEGLLRDSSLCEKEALIWKFFLAKAMTRLVSKARHTALQNLQAKWIKKTISLFYEVIHGNELAILQAKSYAYIGQIVSTRHKLNEAENLCNFSDIKEQEESFKDILENPAYAFRIADSIYPNDNTVLVRLGAYRIALTKSGVQAQQELDKAIDVLTCAIDMYPGYWFAHECRMTACKRKYDIQFQEATKKKNYTDLDYGLLEVAKKDAEFCLYANPTITNLLEFGRILHRIADPPSKSKDIRVNNSNRDDIRGAIDVLDMIDVKFGTHNSPWVYKERANCHYFVNEIEEALLYIEFAFYANNETGLYVVFKQLCSYFITAIENKKNEVKSCFFVIRRLKTVFTTQLQWYNLQKQHVQTKLEGKEEDLSSLDETLLEIIEKKCRELQCGDSFKRFINDFLYFYSTDGNLLAIKNEIKKQTIIREPSVHDLLCENESILNTLLVYNVLNMAKEKAEEWTNGFSQKPQTWMLELDPDEDFVEPETYIPALPERLRSFSPTGKKYDFIILHANEDKDWVVCCLLLQLEHVQNGFKGCIPERDFEPGKQVLVNIKEKINDSNKILIVVSPNTPQKFYDDLKRMQILHCLDLFNKEHRDTYVLNLGVEERPEHLLPFHFIDCSPFPLDLNEVREVLALPPPVNYGQRQLVYVQPTAGPEKGQPTEILSAKCKVDEELKVTASTILQFGIPHVPVYEGVSQLESAEKILEFGFPVSNVLILYEGHVAYFDTEKKIAKWVAYHLTKEDIDGPGDRYKCDFREEPRLPTNLKATPSAYKQGEISKGHMRPAADSKGSKAAMYDSFVYTNIYPEYKNNKMWCALEVYVREKVLKEFPDVRIYVVPAFKAKGSDKFVSYPVVGESKVAVPTHMFKLIIATPKHQDEPLVVGSFVVPNEEQFGKKELDGDDGQRLKYLVADITTNVKHTVDSTGIQFDKMLENAGHKFTGGLLTKCSFITAKEFKDYEARHIEQRKKGTSKKKKTK